MNERPTVAVAGVAFDEDGRVLVVQRGRPPGQGLWTVPGGKVEAGEALTEACRREVREETGLQVRVGELAYLVERMAVGQHAYHFVILGYRVYVQGGELRAADDVQAAKWVYPEELATLETTEGLAEAIAKARAIA